MDASDESAATEGSAATDGQPPEHARRRVPWSAIVKVTIAALVLFAISRVLRTVAAELRESEFSLKKLKLGWLVVAGALHALAQIPMAWYWQRLLHALHISVDFWRTLRAFVYGHLGKYVPGKLLVVIMRSGLLGLRKEQLPVAASTVFIETFTFMAAGSFAAALGIVWLYRGESALQFAALVVMAGMAIATYPPLLRWVMNQLRRWGVPIRYNVAESVNLAVIAKGWAASLVSWALSALSLCAVLLALPSEVPIAMDGVMFGRAMTALCSAVVAGFVSMVPGGLLAREYVLDRLLVPHVGEAPALLATVLLRLVWLLTELAASTILYIGAKKE